MEEITQTEAQRRLNEDRCLHGMRVSVERSHLKVSGRSARVTGCEFSAPVIVCSYGDDMNDNAGIPIY